MCSQSESLLGFRPPDDLYHAEGRLFAGALLQGFGNPAVIGARIGGQQDVREALKTAVEATGQEYEGHGAHGLRWCFAAERMDELQGHGMSRDQALAEVSSEMGHNRPEITEHYLRR